MNTKKTTIVFFFALFISATAFSQTKLTNSLDSLSYAIGVNIGQSLSQQGVKPNTDLIAKAISDVLGSKPTAIELQECNVYI
ncbi:MAG: FKBP-type peptidyl-prolyl cis-trans isomerase N-terminal domain-containing protein, partial [Spirosomaceae bacterium]|nr:FKBP-type peptidyl-prolyl cis-trans isomerase N-terminal domain-containing protein [Spirosomataceae bacterium]